MIFYLLILLIVVLCVYRFIIYPQNHWKRKQIEYLKPRFFFGNFARNFFLQTSFTEIIGDLYNQFKDNQRYVGAYHFTQPMLMIRDLDLIKKITVKDFSYFTDHRTFINEESDDLFGKNLFALRGKKWKHMRSTLSPAFTGSKMRTMLPLIIECCERFSQYFENQIKESNKNYVDLEMKNAMTRITNDVIASVAFGIKCDSLNKPNNNFYLMGKEISSFGSFKFFLKFLVMALFPRIINTFKIRIFDEKLSNYFRSIILDTMDLREKNNIVRPDMIQLLMEAKKEKSMSLETSESNNNHEDEIAFAKNDKENETFNLEDDDIVAQALLFFIAGFETTSVLMCFALHEIAINTDVREKLQAEIDEAMKANNNVLTYDVIMKMTYLDMVINETLRLWTPVAAIDRICVKPYTILPENEHEKPLSLEEGTVIWIPVIGFHSDEKYFENPKKFDPERFSEENKTNFNQNTFMPFGVGPRNCIGSRFALMETKIIIIKILSKFDVEPMSKTQNPIRLKKSSITLNAANGFWIRFKTRNA